jgi:hypothetical protein
MDTTHEVKFNPLAGVAASPDHDSRHTSPRYATSETEFEDDVKPPTLSLPLAGENSYDFLFAPYDSADDTDEDAATTQDKPVTETSPTGWASLKVECSWCSSDDSDDEEPGTDTPPAKKRRVATMWGTPGPTDLPGSLIPDSAVDDTDVVSQPRYSPTHPEYANSVYYEALSRCEEEEREIDRAYADSPFQYRRCRYCHNTTMCAHCCATDNDMWAFREGHRVQSRLAASQSILQLLESHVRQLRNEGGIVEATRFIDRAQRTLNAHHRTMTGRQTNYSQKQLPVKR